MDIFTAAINQMLLPNSSAIPNTTITLVLFCICQTTHFLLVECITHRLFETSESLRVIYLASLCTYPSFTERTKLKSLILALLQIFCLCATVACLRITKLRTEPGSPDSSPGTFLEPSMSFRYILTFPLRYTAPPPRRGSQVSDIIKGIVHYNWFPHVIRHINHVLEFSVLPIFSQSSSGR